MPAAAGGGSVGGMSAHTPPCPPRPEIAELTWIVAELDKLGDTRRQLLARRAVLVAELARPRPPGAPMTGAGPPPPARPPETPAARAGPPPQRPRQAAADTTGGRHEMSRRTVARLLLVAGGTLVVIAAAVFTVANWASIGPAGRGAVLLAAAALALAAPWPLTRRGLAATAEAVAAIGLALTLADAHLAGRLVTIPPGLGPGVAALACAVLAAAWAAYGRLALVRGPRLAAIGLAQFPLPLAAGTISGAGPVAIALAVTTGGDLALAAWAGHARLAAERRVGCLAAAAAAAASAAVAVVSAPAALGVPRWAGLVALTAVAAALLGAGARLRDHTVAGTAVAAGLLVAAGAAVWSLAGPEVALAELAALAVICATAAWVARVRLPAVLATSGAVAAASGAAHAAALAGGLPVRYAAFAMAGVAVIGVGAAPLLRRSRPVQALVLELAAGPVLLVALAMASQRTWTLSLLAGLVALLAAVVAWRSRLAVVREGAAAAAVLSLCASGACAALAAGLPAWQAGLVALAAVAVAQAAAAWLAGPRPQVSLAVEVSGWAAAVAAAAPGLGEPSHASVVLTVTGTLCLCVALRPGRRVLLWLGLAQGEAALCAWLVAVGVHAPEPYTVPAAALLIAAGGRRARCSPGLSSWVSYGPGLAVLLLPSLAAVWLLSGWVRPLVLGLVAAGITLAGGRARLLAPLLLGGVVVILDAGHELAPAVRQLAGMLPGWVPIAVIGVILLAVGATYEARLRDLGRLRAALGKMR
jgi:hypothetical protein